MSSTKIHNDEELNATIKRRNKLLINSINNILFLDIRINKYLLKKEMDEIENSPSVFEYGVGGYIEELKRQLVNPIKIADIKKQIKQLTQVEKS